MTERSVLADYLNVRNFEIREVDGNPGHDDSKIRAATYVTLIEGREVDLSAMLRAAREAISRDIPAAYIIEDNRTYSEIGASGAGQEVIISILSVAADPAIAGAAGAVVSYLIEWAKNERDKTAQEHIESDLEPSTQDVSLDFTIFQVKGMICRTFKISEDFLIVEDAETQNNRAIIKIRDASTADVYLVSTEEGYLVTKIQKL